MVPRTLAIVVAGVVLSLPLSADGTQSEDTAEYRQKLVAEKRYAEAFEAYRQALAKNPTNPSLLYNTGLMAYLSGKPKEAITPWSKLKELEPDDWQVRSKLIQAYEATAQKKQRDDERNCEGVLGEERKAG